MPAAACLTITSAHASGGYYFPVAFAHVCCNPNHFLEEVAYLVQHLKSGTAVKITSSDDRKDVMLFTRPVGTVYRLL
jgi:hypothetical protein